MTTYNQITKAFELFATKHKQINTYHIGKLAEFQTTSIQYPAMVIIPQQH